MNHWGFLAYTVCKNIVMQRHGLISLRLRDSHLMWQVESCDAKGPEAAKHGENAEAQMVPRGHHEEIVFTLWITRVLTLHKTNKTLNESKHSSYNSWISTDSYLSQSDKLDSQETHRLMKCRKTIKYCSPMLYRYVCAFCSRWYMFNM